MQSVQVLQSAALKAGSSIEINICTRSGASIFRKDRCTRRLAAVKDPEHDGNHNADNEAGDDREIDGDVVSGVSDIAG